jgi:hypothetical protein
MSFPSLGEVSEAYLSETAAREIATGDEVTFKDPISYALVDRVYIAMTYESFNCLPTADGCSTEPDTSSLESYARLLVNRVEQVVTGYSESAPTGAVPTVTVTPPTPTPAPRAGTSAPFGVSMTFDEVGVTVNQHEVPVTDDLWTPEPGNVFLALDVTYCATTTGASYNPFDWELEMEDFTRRTPGIGVKEPTLNSGELAATGDCVRGWITFEVPAGSPRVVSAIYSGSLFTGQTGKWRFP